MFLFGKHRKEETLRFEEALKTKNLEDLTRALKSKSGQIRNRACEVLAEMGDDGIRALIYDTDARTWERKAEGLIKRVGKAAVKHLIGAAEANKENAWWGTRFISVLRSIADRSVAGRLAKLATDRFSHMGVRCEALIALSNLGDVGQVDALIEALSTDIDSRVRGNAASALRSIRHPRAIGPLVDTLLTPPDPNRGAWCDPSSVAGDALSEYGAEVVTVLLSKLRNRRRLDKETQSRVRWLLVDAGDDAVPHLKRTVEEADSELAQAVAKEALEMIEFSRNRRQKNGEKR